MSDTYSHKRQRLLKTAIIERKRELGIGRTGMPLVGFADSFLVEVWHEFWRGARRHGNKRKAVAKEKVKKRKAERKNGISLLQDWDNT